MDSAIGLPVSEHWFHCLLGQIFNFSVPEFSHVVIDDIIVYQNIVRVI